MELLNNKKAEVRLAAASALAVMPAPAAQQAIAKLALSADLDEKVRVAVLNSACDSVRRFGNQFAPDQQNGVLEMVTGKGSAELRDAAAQLLGALSLPSDKVKSLILQTGAK
jgi:HEAT repeat protein